MADNAGPELGRTVTRDEAQSQLREGKQEGSSSLTIQIAGYFSSRLSRIAASSARSTVDTGLSSLLVRTAIPVRLHRAVSDITRAAIPSRGFTEEHLCRVQIAAPPR